MHRIFLLFTVLAVIPLACTSHPVRITLPAAVMATRAPAATLTPVLTRTPTVYVTRTPIPTKTPFPTLTATLTPTPMNLPAAASLKLTFQNEVRPLAARLKAAVEASTAPEIKPEDLVILVPESERLHYVQSILFMDRPPVAAGERQLYALYSSSRSTPLGIKYLGTPPMSATTQALNGDLRLVLMDGGRLTLLEKKTASGGDGSANYLDMVERAVLPFDRLGSRKTAVEKDLQLVIGYAGGLNMDSRLDSHRKTALFTSALQSDSWADRRHAADAFKEMIPPPASAGPILIAALDDSNSMVRRAALEALKIFAANGEAIPLVIEVSRSSKENQRAAAAEILGDAKTHPQEALQALIRLLMDQTQTIAVRRIAAESLGNLALPEAVAALSAALADSDSNVRAAAVRALGSCGETNPAAVIPALRNALKDRDNYVRSQAALAFSHLGAGGRAVLPELKAALMVETDDDTFSALAYSIKTLGSKAELLPLLIEATRAKDARVRRGACKALQDYKGTPEAAQALTAAFGDSDMTVVFAAVNALTWFGAEAKIAVPDLIRLLEGSPSKIDLQYLIMGTLKNIGPGAKAAVPALIKNLSSTNSSLKTAAKTALQAITLQDYGEDKVRWEEWWQVNK